MSKVFMLDSFCESHLISVKVKFIFQPIVEVKGSNGAVDRDYLLIPVELAKVSEEFMENLKRCFEFLVEVVDQEDHQHVQSISGHVSGMTTEQARLISHPTLEHENGLLEQVLLAHLLSQKRNKINCTQAASLLHRDVDQSALGVEFDDLHVGLVYQHYVLYLKRRGTF